MRGKAVVLLPIVTLIPLLSGCVSADVDASPSFDWGPSHHDPDWDWGWTDGDGMAEAMFAMFLTLVVGALLVALFVGILAALLGALTGRRRDPPVQIVYVERPPEFRRGPT